MATLKDKPKHLEVTNNNLIDASGFALLEAFRWSDTADAILNKSNLRTQYCICALFSIELFMKAILMSNNINVKNYSHNLYNMYKDIEIPLQNKLKENIRIDKKIIIELTKKEIIFNTFEEELKYIANDFMYLRYEYEKFVNGYNIITLTNFISSIKENIKDIAFSYVNKKNKRGKKSLK